MYVNMRFYLHYKDHEGVEIKEYIPLGNGKDAVSSYRRILIRKVQLVITIIQSKLVNDE